MISRLGHERRGVILLSAMAIDDSLPTDLASAHALIIAQRQALSVAEARAMAAESEAQYRALLIEKLKYTIKKLQHERFGSSSERSALLEQLELQLAELEEDSAQAEAAARMAAAATAETITVPSFERRKPARRPLPEHLPRERIVYSILPTMRESNVKSLTGYINDHIGELPRGNGQPKFGPVSEDKVQQTLNMAGISKVRGPKRRRAA